MTNLDRRRPLLLALAFLMGGSPGDAVAQRAAAAAPDSRAEPDHFCWRGRPPPVCSGFVVVEASVRLPLGSTSHVETLPQRTAKVQTFEEPELDWNFGYMANVSRRWAVGGVVTVGTGSSGALTGLEGRVRYWLDERLSLELQAGALRTDLGGRDTRDPPWGITADVRLNAGDNASLFVRWDAVRPHFDPRMEWTGETQHAFFAGLGTGSTWAVASSAAGVLVLFILFSQADFQ